MSSLLILPISALPQPSAATTTTTKSASPTSTWSLFSSIGSPYNNINKTDLLMLGVGVGVSGCTMVICGIIGGIGKIFKK